MNSDKDSEESFGRYLNYFVSESSKTNISPNQLKLEKNTLESTRFDFEPEDISCLNATDSFKVQTPTDSLETKI